MSSPSYFDLPPQSKVTGAAAALQVNEAGEWTKTSLLSPQITHILDELDLEDQSSSSSEAGSLSDDETQPMHSDKNFQHRHHKDKREINTKKEKPPSQSLRKSAPDSSSKPSSGHVSKPVSRPGSGGKPVAAQHPHMARFHSLRSMLFLSKIEQNIMKVKKEECIQEEAASEWRDQHAQRQINKPKTPEREITPKDGLSRKITTKLRRITSKEAPVMGRIKESKDSRLEGRESTASSDNEDERTGFVQKHHESDEKSIDHSDLDDLVRWVSRRDPPSDGEASKGAKLDFVEQDSAHESLGDSDVDELVRWTSRKSKAEKEEQAHLEQTHSGYSDASTEEDSDANNKSSDDEDTDELVRWVSRREGPKAGPVRQKANSPPIDQGSDVSKLDLLKSQRDSTSDELNAGSERATSAHQTEHSPEPTRGRSKERSSENRIKRHLTHEDVDELVQWVSRKDSKHQDALEDDAQALQLQHQEEEQKKKVGMVLDEGSLSHGDIEDLVRFVSRG